MVRYLLHRLGRTVAVLIGVTALLYLTVELQPGSVEQAICGADGCEDAVATDVARVFGSERGPAGRAVAFVTAAATLDFGPSLSGEASASATVAEHLGASVALTASSLLVGALLLAAVAIANVVIDRDWLQVVILVASVGALLLPLFWLGLLVRAAMGPGHLPAAAVLAFGGSAFGVRRVHERVRAGLDADHVRLARTYGVPERRILIRHGLRPAVPPALEALAAGVGVVLGGLILLEPMFDRAGVGAAIAAGILSHDRTVVLAGVSVLVTTFVIGRSLLLFAARLSEPPRNDRWATS